MKRFFTIAVLAVVSACAVSFKPISHKPINAILCSPLLAPSQTSVQFNDTVSSKDVVNHIGKVVTVRGTIVSTRLIASNNMTLLNVGGNYPNQDFTIVIRSANRNKFGQPEVTFQGKTVTVTGTVTEYRGKPEIEVTDPSQITSK